MGAMSGNAMNVNGTNGLNVGDAKNMGWNQGDIQRSGTTPNAWQNLLKGGERGLGRGLQNYAEQAQQMQRPMNPYFYGGPRG